MAERSSRSAACIKSAREEWASSVRNPFCPWAPPQRNAQSPRSGRGRQADEIVPCHFPKDEISLSSSHVLYVVFLLSWRRVGRAGGASRCPRGRLKEMGVLETRCQDINGFSLFCQASAAWFQLAQVGPNVRGLASWFLVATTWSCVLSFSWTLVTCPMELILFLFSPL